MDFYSRRAKPLIAFLAVVGLWVMISYEFKYNNYYRLAMRKMGIKYHTRTNETLKYILIWTHITTEPFSFFELGRKGFTGSGCKFNNCYITNDRYLLDIEEWDAVLFHAPEYTWLRRSWNHGVPSLRSPKQVYILGCVESSANYPICEEKWNLYFNWTFTYRIDSDVPWYYFIVRDASGKIVAPAKEVNWKTDMEDVSQEFKNRLKTKTKAVAWFASNCNALNNRKEYITDLNMHLEKYGYNVDIYGRCGNLICPAEDDRKCDSYLENDYYFYLAFENSFSEDYVTEKLLRAMQNDIVPIVYGPSDYSRFAPPGSYINAREYNPQELSEYIHNLIGNFDEYVKFFKWKKYYTYHSIYDSYETHPLCNLCESLNDPTKSRISKYDDFRLWWNGNNEKENNINC